MTTLPDHLAYPAFQTKCSACEMVRQDVTLCEKYKCCYSYQRRGHEQRVKDDARSGAERGRNVSLQEAGR